MYHAELGQFLTRDPLPQAGQPDVLYDNNEFGRWLDLMKNLYGYGLNNPVRYGDPFGLDVRIQNTTALLGGIHQRVCVDTWDDACCSKTGQYCISFGMLGEGDEPGPPSDTCDDKYFPFTQTDDGTGAVYEDNADPESKRPLVKFFNLVVETKKQGCEEDKKALEYFKSLLNRRATYVNPPAALPHKVQNCRRFSRSILDHVKKDPRYNP